MHHLEFLEPTAVNGQLENGSANGDKNSDGNVTPPGEKLPNGAEKSQPDGAEKSRPNGAEKSRPDGAEKSRPDVILVTGRLENCEAAKEAMLVGLGSD